MSQLDLDPRGGFHLHLHPAPVPHRQAALPALANRRLGRVGHRRRLRADIHAAGRPARELHGCRQPLRRGERGHRGGLLHVVRGDRPHLGRVTRAALSPLARRRAPADQMAMGRGHAARRVLRRQRPCASTAGRGRGHDPVRGTAGRPGRRRGRDPALSPLRHRGRRQPHARLRFAHRGARPLLPRQRAPAPAGPAARDRGVEPGGGGLDDRGRRPVPPRPGPHPGARGHALLPPQVRRGPHPAGVQRPPARRARPRQPQRRAPDGAPGDAAAVTGLLWLRSPD